MAKNTGNRVPFEGFSSPNYTQVPDEVFDVLAPDLSEAELRVLLYIVRRTFGFKKAADDISLKQLVDGIRTKDGVPLDRGAGYPRSADRLRRSALPPSSADHRERDFRPQLPHRLMRPLASRHPRPAGARAFQAKGMSHNFLQVFWQTSCRRQLASPLAQLGESDNRVDQIIVRA